MSVVRGTADAAVTEGDFRVRPEADLNAALQQIDLTGSSSAPNTAYTITFANGIDLTSQLDAINLASGQPRWTLDLGTHPDVQAPGMIYGGVVIHGGRIYVATCNLDGSNARQTTVIACIGEK